MAEHMTPVVAKVLPEEKAAFAAATRHVGTTPSNAIRMFIAAFNRCGTFPFDISPSGAFGLPDAPCTVSVPEPDTLTSHGSARLADEPGQVAVRSSAGDVGTMTEEGC